MASYQDQESVPESLKGLPLSRIWGRGGIIFGGMLGRDEA